MSPELYHSTADSLKWLLGTAWLLPLIGFVIEIFGASWGSRTSKAAAYFAVGCIGTGFLCSVIALLTWGNATHWSALGHDVAVEAHAGEPEGAGAEHPHEHAVAAGEAGHSGAAAEHGAGEHHANDPLATAFSGSFYELGRFGSLVVSLDYYADGLTVVMFCMVTLIATCIHVFAVGYMSDELTEDHEDHEVHLSGGRHFHRPGRHYQFFAYLSLFSFSMLGLVIAGNIFMVFVFWELVGVCSYLLIGFYIERKSASTAANKAFIMNRVGDFGFLIGLMILWTSFGTFRFADPSPEAAPADAGLFQMVRDHSGYLEINGEGRDAIVYLQDGKGARLTADGVDASIPYWLLVAAGLGIFAGCVGKSAQFPLQTWLPDAMEGPTPVSALVHSATMVAAGVYLAGRFFPMFTPEVLLTIAYVGCITLFIGATIAIVATDIKRVLAYSTISQLGYMMLALGVGGWVAGLFHLITHAFFKSLMFLCSGSVIYGCHHVQEMTRMGGLRKKMPITAYTMLIGVIAISGLAIPFITLPFFGNLAFSGYYSKDEIVATALTYMSLNPAHFLLFLVPLVTAGITAFYMFRLWFLTFAGEPRDQHVHEHAHESPWVMTGPLVVLSVFAVGCAWGMEIKDGHLAPGYLVRLLLSSEPALVAAGVTGAGHLGLNLPGHEQIHHYHSTAGAAALLAALSGLVISYLVYVSRIIDPATVARQLAGTYNFLVEKWQFDHLYDAMFVRPVHVVARWCQVFDRDYLDAFLHALTRCTVWVAKWDRVFDEKIVDRAVNNLADVTYAVGRSLRAVQTGSLRQYVMSIAVGVVALFIILFALLPWS